MKILVALDTTSQSSFVVEEVARLATTTWADITLLGIEAEGTSGNHRFTSQDCADASHPLVRSLREHRTRFLTHFETQGSPYTETAFAYEWIEVKKGLWEDLKVCRGSHKRLNTRIRPGNPSRAILMEARQYPCDLIVISSTAADAGGEIGRSAKKVTREAEASVLVVAESKRPRRIVACLDHDQVSQHALEMINQMLTLYQADLEIAGLTAEGKASDEIDRKMSQILRYYTDNGIKALVKLVPQRSLEAFAAQAAQEDLVALLAGRQSLLHKFITPRSMDRILATSDASVLILR